MTTVTPIPYPKPPRQKGRPRGFKPCDQFIIEHGRRRWCGKGLGHTTDHSLSRFESQEKADISGAVVRIYTNVRYEWSAR